MCDSFLCEQGEHWMICDEDRCRAREGFAAENLTATRQVTLKLDTSVRAGIKSKRKNCG
ncbi:MAG: hypothetical protein KAG53_07060 [Endozoicomonadaceae bacterium]|nr:hypothetical protein [Endozoicomonadaceae bacterium]